MSHGTDVAGNAALAICEAGAVALWSFDAAGTATKGVVQGVDASWQVERLGDTLRLSAASSLYGQVSIQAPLGLERQGALQALASGGQRERQARSAPGATGPGPGQRQGSRATTSICSCSGTTRPTSRRAFATLRPTTVTRRSPRSASKAPSPTKRSRLG